jgi:hypothetical protein
MQENSEQTPKLGRLVRVAAVAGLLLILGVVITLKVLHSHPAATPKPSSTASTHPSGVSAAPAMITNPAPSALSNVDIAKKIVAGAPVLKPVSRAPIGKPAQAHTERAIAKPLPVKQVAANHEVAQRRPYVSPRQPAAPMRPSAQELANLASPSQPFWVGIEGDLTVAYYDGSAGTVGTYEGSNFILSAAEAASEGIPWQNFPFDVHYRCKESGACTLVRGSETATASIAR